jgi:integrase
MAGDSDDPAHRFANERGRVKQSDLSKDDVEAVLELLAALDPNDMSTTFVDDTGEQETLAYSSLMDYGRGLRDINNRIESDLLNASVAEIRDSFDAMLDDLADQTVRQRGAAARKFYRYHDTSVDPDKIPLVTVSHDSGVDERDILTEGDIEAIRDVCDNTRDRALVELLIYTGQRLRAIQTLRLKDIDLDDGVYYLNETVDGLKGADGKRPLLGAEKPVRQWLENHPTGNDDDYLITSLPSATGTKGPGEYLSKIAIYNRLRTLFERADVDKPDGQMAHTFRHYFVTVCYRDYDMDPATIKYLIGHEQGSTVMETTYQHLTDQDHIDAAREARNVDRGEDTETGTALTPAACPTCNEPLSSGAKACPDCGEIFAPDAKAAQESYQSDAEARIVEVESEQEARIIQGMLSDLRENPEDYLE